jgi:hypothetical protein
MLTPVTKQEIENRETGKMVKGRRRSEGGANWSSGYQ